MNCTPIICPTWRDGNRVTRPPTERGGQRSESGERPRLGKRRCVDCNRWHRPLTAAARRCGSCGARHMAFNRFMKAMRS